MEDSVVYYIYKEVHFSAAHQLREYNGKCENLHGHNWKVRAFLKSKELDSLGMVEDFSLLKKRLNDILDTLDHHFLNDVPPFDIINPSAENIAKFLFDELKKNWSTGRVTVAKVEVWESQNSCAIYEEQ